MKGPNRNWPKLGFCEETLTEKKAWKSYPPEDPNVAKVMQRAEIHLASVEYKPSIRWLFYRIWQDGALDYVKATGKKNKKQNASATLTKYLLRSRSDDGTV